MAERLLEPDEAIPETEINARLAEITDDIAAMRRYLVDAGHLERARDGSAYSLAR